MWNKTVTLYIDDTSIRLLVLSGQRMIKWADVHLEPGLIKGSVVMDQAGVAGRIRQLLKDQDIRAKRVILGISGLHSLTRPAVLPEMPRAMLTEAVAREARRVLPVPLDQLYLSWRTLPSLKARTKIFMVAIPRKAADTLVKTIQAAGLEPYRMSIKPLALTRVIPANTAVILDVQSREYDIVVLSDGVPHPLRTVSFPEQELSPGEKLDMIIGDLERTILFYDSNNPENTLGAAAPVYVSGHLTGDQEMRKKLADATGRPVMTVNALLQGGNQIDPGRYMVNMALASRKPAPAREPTFPVANMNILPAPYQPKPISLTRVIGIPGAVAVVAVIVPIMLTMQSTSASIESMEGQLKTINQLITQRTAQRAALNKDITGLKADSEAAKKAYNNFTLSLSALMAGQEKVNGDLGVALDLLPPTITLTNISQSQGAMLIDGHSISEKEILRYARKLDLSGRFTGTTVSSYQVEDSGAGSDWGIGRFVFKLTLKSKE